MNVLVINAGSSSVKFTCFNMDDKTVMASGIVERIGFPGTRTVYKNAQGAKIQREVDVTDARQAIGVITDFLTDAEVGVIKSLDEISAVGHRVLHGREKISDTVVVDERVKQIIRECIPLGPLHNPHNLNGIEACEKHFPRAPQVAVFDTAFHATMPVHAHIYGLPFHFYEEDHIRKYGFHGTSHRYVSKETARFLGRDPKDLKIIVCHLGNGCSISAVRAGICVDTSMGLTPLEGLIMGTRAGDLDPAVVWYLMEHKNLDYKEINELLNKKSGLLGMAGIGSGDLRDIESAAAAGNRQAEIALNAFTYRIKKYIGAYAAAMGGVDVLVFTAGVGENSDVVRAMVCEGLEGLNGIVLDPQKNKDLNRKKGEIQSDDSRVKILIIPTDEEQEIAQQTLNVLGHE